jgi:15-cis-phytoene synthase
MSGTGTDIQRAFDYCAQRVRENDKDRFLASLFVPAQQRGAVLALLAFDCEIDHVRDRINSPLPGEVRLQYWRDVLTGTGQGDSAGNPVAVALLDTVQRHSLPISTLLDVIDAHTFDLYDEPMTSLAELDRYATATAAAIIVLSMQVLNDGAAPRLDVLARHCGMALTIAGLLQRLPQHVARGQWYLPGEILVRHGVKAADIRSDRTSNGLRDALAEMRRIARNHLAALRDQLSSVPRQMLPALLPVALVPPLLQRMDAPQYDPFRPPIVPQWRKQWTLWRAAKRPNKFIGVG